MINRVRKTIKQYNMLSNGDRVVVGVSGGADSMALMNILLSLRKELSLDIAVAHIEHGIRGEESKTDAEFVKNYCLSRNIEFHMLSINAVDEAKNNGMGVEEYSRKARYEFFNSLEPDKIATAHNLNDNAETLVFRLLRGTGLKGACSIPPVRDNIIRPLIDISSDDIRDFCKKSGIEYRIDSTNLSCEYSRNYIRNELFPLFADINDDYLGALSSFINDANDDYYFIDDIVEKEYDKCIENNKLLVSELKSLHSSISKRIIAGFFQAEGVVLDRVHLCAVFELLNKSSKIQIKGNIFAVSDKRYIRIVDFSDNTYNQHIVSEILKINEFVDKSVDFYCDYDKINGDVVFRSRQAGDRIHPAGKNYTKSLKKLYNELSVPIEERENALVVCDDLGIIGVVGYCVDERVKLDSDSVNVYTIRIHTED